ncbi:MAG TPA: hypothetical protein VMX97_04830, partial [Hyphomicrobiaceae bacterium]|nr:hypothetical protein [Hyphomicrobiaceae bacterium]
GYIFSDRYFTVRGIDGRLLLAGIEGVNIIPYGSPDSLYEPVYFDIVEGVCPLKPDDCFDAESLALDITCEDVNERVFDGEEIILSSDFSYRIQVMRAQKLYDRSVCTDVPGSIYYIFIAGEQNL